MSADIERYSRRTRILHWMHTAAYSILLVTGFMLFRPPFEFLRETIWVRALHRFAATLFITAPLWYLLSDPHTAFEGLKTAFSWSKGDIAWWKALPRTFLIGDKKAVPPQGFLTGGQKSYWLLVVLSGAVFILTGGIMWFFKTSAPPSLLKWAIFLHDLAFVVTGVMFFVHIYMAFFNPMMSGAWRSMVRGKVSADYVQQNHPLWYKEINHDK